MHIDKIKVKNLMSKKGILTQTELAEIMGITKGQLSIILSEKYNPFKSSIEHLCEVLATSPLDILAENMTSTDEPIVIPQKKPEEVSGIELFAGAGGLALGLEQSGIETLAHIEIDKY